ncbi:hypothetical protein [Solwaraspora sp. WMMA2065]|uniref:hypothetical protein n=1 Tax=Solwaraspora sp. WMMA2065 TaxID=3015166 RepID=UPI00259B54DC|nr:hypothetical protein [Solwaraspora sp. WMMA2065]WJK35310.1 hypothetical protein O7610_02685 [Solwaraspora sp. WMMA2065]
MPWLAGQARIVTPIAAMAIGLVTVFDSLTNRMDAADATFNTAVLVMAVTVAAGRFHDLSSDTGPTPPLGWSLLLTSTALVVVAIWGARYAISPALRWAQAVTGLASVLVVLSAFAGLWARRPSVGRLPANTPRSVDENRVCAGVSPVFSSTDLRNRRQDRGQMGSGYTDQEGRDTGKTRPSSRIHCTDSA